MGWKKKPGPSTAWPPARTAAWSGEAVEEAADAGELVGVVERAVVDVLVGGAGRGPLGLFGEGRYEIVVDGARDEYPGRGGAVLARVEVARACDAFGCCRHVRVVEDDNRGFAAQFEVGAFEVGGGGFGHLHASADAAGDRDHVGDRMGDEGAAGVAVAADDVEHAGRQELVGHLGQQGGAGGVVSEA